MPLLSAFLIPIIASRQKLWANIFEGYSAGTETKPQINPNTVRLMKQLHDIDMRETQYSKRLSQLQHSDIPITMDFNDQCLFLP